MRYQPDQKVWTLALALSYAESGAPSVNFHSVKPIPGLYKIDGIQFYELTITEHHRVPGEWSDQLQHDGFIAVDSKGNKWANQYPRASYGQMNDEADGDFQIDMLEKMCTDSLATKDNRSLEDMVSELKSKGLAPAAYDLCRFMGTLDGGVLDSGGVKRHAQESGLSEKLHAISKRIQSEFTHKTGMKLVSYTETFGSKEKQILFKRWRVEAAVPINDSKSFMRVAKKDGRLQALDELSAIDQKLNLL